MMYRMRTKKSTYSNSDIHEDETDNSESISDDYAGDIVDKGEQLEKEQTENTVMNNTEESLTTISEQSQINDLTNLEIQDIEGIGPTTAKKLREAGIFSVMDLAVAGVEDLAVDINASKDSAASFIMAAQKLLRESDVLDKEFISAETALKKRRSLLRCSTGSSMLDDLFLGGMETQAVTELYGEFGSGKSQICHTMCITAGQPIESGGLNSGVIYIDTEGTFRPERLEQISSTRSIDPVHALQNVAVCKVYNSAHLELIVKNLGKYIDDYKAKLVIIDGIISLHRAEFAGRGTLADRQQRLNGMLHKIIRLAEIFNIAIVITNQVQSSPDTFFGDPTKAAGGNIIAHSSPYRINHRRQRMEIISKLVRSIGQKDI